MGNNITGSKDPRKFKHRAAFHSAGAWKLWVSNLVEEACKTNYFSSSRGAAICLRIALEQVINIQLLGRNYARPRQFKPLERAMVDAVHAGRLREQDGSKGLAERIKDLGDTAAHPQAGGRALSESRVDLAIGDMETLLELVNSV